MLEDGLKMDSLANKVRMVGGMVRSLSGRRSCRSASMERKVDLPYPVGRSMTSTIWGLLPKQ